MIVVKRIVVTLGMALLIAVVTQLVAPRAVHGVVATLVSVVGNVSIANPSNSGGNPEPLVIRDADNGVRQEYYATQTCTITGGTDCEGQVGIIVPAGRVLALEDVSGFCRMDQPGDFITQTVLFILSNPSDASTVKSISLPVDQPKGPVVAYGRQVSLYLSAGEEFSFQPFSGAGDQTGSCAITYAGYMINK